MLKSKTHNEEIRIAIEQLKEMNFSKTIHAEWEYHLKQKSDRHAREEYVYDEGQKQKALEVANNLLDILDPSIIAYKTGLSLEEVMKLKREKETVDPSV